MKNLTKIEADLLALEIVATTLAGVGYQDTNNAIEYAISKNLEIDITSVSAGMASMPLDNPTCVVKLCFQNSENWDLWSPTLKINSTTIADEAIRLSTWLYNMTNVDHDVILED